MTKTTEAKWRAVIWAQEKSGLSALEFAELHGIMLTTLYWWRSRLRRGSTRSTDLVPVEVVAHQVVASRAAGPTAPFELRLDDSMTLQIQSGFDEAELCRLLRALRC